VRDQARIVGDMNVRCPDRAALDRHAARQLGLFTRSQAIACGFSPRQISRRRLEGDWVDVRRPVLAERGLPLTPKVRDFAVQLTIPGSVLAGPSAARWHGVELPSRGTFIAFGRPQHRRPRDVLVFPEPVPPEDIVALGGATATTIQRTVFDCARVLPDLEALALLERGLEEGWTTLADLGDRATGFASRHGAPRLVRLLQKAALGTHCAARGATKRLLRQAGLWDWDTDVPVADRWGLICVGDFVFQKVRLLIELEGAAYDVRGERAELVRRRHLRLLASGWTVLTFSWHHLTARPHDVVDAIRLTRDRLGG
jgi:hypothetical protein